MSELNPITREERLLNSISDGVDSGIEPLTREEHYLSAIAGETELPSDMTPLTRREKYLQKIYDNGGAGGGGEAEGTVEINITQNGTITRNVARYASAEITTNVPNPSTGTKEITQNGDHDVTDFATAHVDVPNSYSASDEGKVVSNGALVAQTSRNVTANGTYDTTLNDEVVVNVPTGITPTGTLNIRKDGTYNVSEYASVEVNTLMEKITVSGTAVTQALDPNKFYVFGEVASLIVTLGTEVSGYVNEYHFRFTSGATATTLSLPQTVNMPSDFAVEANKTYEISIVDGFGTVTAW